MPFSADPAKAAANLAKHGVAFEAVEAFEWTRAQVEADTRQHYGEVRLIAIGPIVERLHVLIFTIRRGGIHIISLRKANSREFDRYVSRA